ncbi:MAG: hypothetical protein AAF957_28335 [Planctomycetota bacterium]
MTDDASEGDEGIPELDPNGQLFSLLGAPDRDRCPGARPVVAVDEDDDQAYIDEVQSLCVAAPRLVRRGAFHGNWAELHDSLAFVPRDPLATLAQRFEDARPIVLHDALPDDALDAALGPSSTDTWYDALREEGGLDELLEARAFVLGPEFRSTGARTPAVPDERDIASTGIAWRAPSGRPTRGPSEVDDFWVKTQRLSTHEDDASVRVRLSFGREVEDDASRDRARHGLVSELAARLFPEAAAIQADSEIPGLIGDWIGGRPLFTQAIAYWNAPGGGALFHHDAFDEPARGSQRGVLYAQLTGSTAWIALSIEDLHARVTEFLELMADGTFPWLVEGRFGGGGGVEDLLDLARDRGRALAELAKPGSGALGPVVDQGPEFTSLLAIAGHAYVLGPGDVIVLPNHGLERTCMHSVFCADEEVAFSLSLAIRDGSSPAGGGHGRRGGGRRGRGRRRGGRGRGPGSSRRRRR